jgi:radical SAM protein with 4Fe4S-binding SPASM domain
LGDNYHLANHLFFEPRDKYYQDGAKDKNFLRKKVKPKICKQCEVIGICQGIDEAYFNLSVLS